MYMEERGAGNSLIDNRVQKQSLMKHKKAVKYARRRGDPETLKDWRDQETAQRQLNNAKAAQMDDERLSQIEQDNITLFKKMKEIEHKPLKSLDFSHLNIKKHMIIGRIHAKRTEIERIENENFKLLKRIHAVSPTYDHSKMANFRKKQEYLIKKKCKYPYILQKSSND